MDFPRDFQILAINMVAMLDEKIESDEHFLELMLDGINQGGCQELIGFLDLVLDGRYNDAQLDDLLTKTGTDFIFYRPGDTRQFLTIIRDQLANKSRSRCME